MDIQIEIAKLVDVAKQENKNLSYIEIGESLNITPGRVKSEVKYIRSLDNSLGHNPFKYFDSNCRDENPASIMRKIRLLPESKQKEIEYTYYTWREMYLKSMEEL